MIAAAGGSWPSPHQPAEPRPEQNSGTRVGDALELLERVLELTRSAVERFEDNAVDEALHLLDRRDSLFAEAGEVLGRLSARYHTTAVDGHLQAVAQRAIIEELTTTAAELGRLDSWIANRLVSLQKGVHQQLLDLTSTPDPDGSPVTREMGRHIDLCG